RHSGLAEVAAALEGFVGRPALFSFEPGDGAPARIAEALFTVLAMPDPERTALREAVRTFVGSEWTWERSAERLLVAAGRYRESGATRRRESSTRRVS